MEILFLGHCYEQGKHDKIWGLIQEENGALSFWGRRGGSLSFKRYANRFDALNQSHTKSKKYISKGPDEWSKLLPGDFEGQVMLAKLGQIKFG